MADRYWNPAAAANWSDANVWAATDGGTADQATPTSSDNVYFTSTNVNNCTVTAIANCANLTFTGGTGYTGTFATGIQALGIYGSTLTLNSGMGLSGTGTIQFYYTGTCNLTTNGKALTQILRVSTAGVTLAFNDNTTCAYLYMTTGAMNLGSYTITCTSTSYVVRITGGTVTAGTSKIIGTGSGSQFVGGGQTYYDVELQGTNHTIAGVNTFNNLKYTAALPGTLYLSNDQTITGLLELKGQSETQRLLAFSSSVGTNRTLTVNGTIDITHCILRDITGAGTVSWDLSAFRVGNGGGLTDITTTAAQNHYWIDTDGGNWNATTSWSNTSGGATNNLIPLQQDTAYFDANSITSASRTIYFNTAQICTVDCTGLLNNPTISVSQDVYCYGSLKFITGMTYSGASRTWWLYGRSSGNTIDTAGKTLYKISIAGGGTYTLNSNLTLSYSLVSWYSTFDANSYDVTSVIMEFGYGTLYMGSGTFTVTAGNGAAWTSFYGNVYPETSTLYFNTDSGSSRYQYMYGRTFNKVIVNALGTGYFDFYGGATIAELTLMKSNNTTQNYGFEKNKTWNIGKMIAVGDATYPIKINSTDSTAILTTSAPFMDGLDYCNISYITASPADTWYTGANSIDSGNNSGWVWSAYGGTPPASKNNILMLV